ncbi:MAG TPA: secondary thiamine-phosphate synthase enzyme YjbQ [Elusimicrobiales bacterium]|nr:secondary thiamine-phosphate synthase enzyme YjbQ [Elusimicrobiales bacterium]
MKHRVLKVRTSAVGELADITAAVRAALPDGAVDGVCHLFCPHTTCALAVNENADPSVKSDVLAGLSEAIDGAWPYRHAEGNSPAHIKSVLTGPSLTLFVEDGRLRLGVWQSVYLCEYDGPRDREVWVKFLQDPRPAV